jgi:hypothetical protein
MLGAQKPLHFRQGDERGQKLLRDLRGEQAVAILGEGRGVEHGLVDGKPNEPAKQKVKLDPLDQLALRADRIEKLQKRRPQRMLRRCPRLHVNVREQRPARPILASHRPLAIHQPTAQQNHATTTNTRNPAPHFFSALLKRAGNPRSAAAYAFEKRPAPASSSVVRTVVDMGFLGPVGRSATDVRPFHLATVFARALRLS